MSYRNYTLPIDAITSDEEIVSLLRSKINKAKQDPEKFVYRGLQSTPQKLQRIRTIGTDRVASEWEEAAKRFFEQNQRGECDGVSMRDAQESTDPSYTWAASNENLTDAVESARIMGEGPIQVIVGYRTDELEMVERYYTNKDFYKFRTTPLRALSHVFTLKE
jgi:hypothetical protein